MRSMPSDGCSLCIGAVQAIRTPVAANKAAASDVAMPCQAYAQQKPESNSPCPALSPAAGLRSYRRATADQARELGASPTSRARSLSSSAAGAPTIRIETGSRETMPCFSKAILTRRLKARPTTHCFDATVRMRSNRTTEDASRPAISRFRIQMRQKLTPAARRLPKSLDTSLFPGPVISARYRPDGATGKRNYSGSIDSPRSEVPAAPLLIILLPLVRLGRRVG
jgi:hypothetical protein